jgi:Domain of unknown function (DUF4129)
MLRRVNWIQSIILPLATSIIVAAWAGPLIHWLVRSTGIDASIVTPSSQAIVAMILASIYVTRFALRDDRPKRQRNLIVIGGGLIGVVIVLAMTYRDRFPLGYIRGLVDWRDSISPEAILLVALALIWWRGISAGHRDALTDESFEGAFYRGIAALAVLTLLNTSTHFVAPDDLLISVLTFFSVATAVLALINIERTRRRQKDHSAPWRRIYRQWLATIVSVVVFILLGGLGVTSIVAPETVGRFFAIIQPLLDALSSFITAILTVLFTVAAWLATPLLPILQWIAQLIFKVLMAGLTLLNNLGLVIDRLKATNDFNDFLNSPTFVTVSRSVVLIAILIVIALVAIWGLRRSGLLGKKQADEIRESIASRQLLWAQLKNLLARLWSRSSSVVQSMYLTLDGSSDDPRLIIRRAYQSMLEWARLNGRARFPYQTPLMYADALGADLPHINEAIASLTHAYVLARYSIDPLPPDEARRAQAALEQLQEPALDSLHV